MNELMTAREVALKVLGDEAKEWRVQQLARDGLMPCVRMGRRVFFHPDQVERYLESGGRALAGGWRREPASARGGS